MTFTTNAEDQQKAAALKARLAEGSSGKVAEGSNIRSVPNVSIDEGKNKYVLVSACLPGGKQRENFVVSRRGAQYHRDTAEPFVELLEKNSYSSIRIAGGGRIVLDNQKKTCSIYGHSYGFGLADHALSKAVIEADSRYQDYDITWSNEGY
eukprot:scaffold443_cov125-Cylindrotheca_fusiformis.AAC.6